MDGRDGPYRGEFLHSTGGMPVEYHEYNHGGEDTKDMAMGMAAPVAGLPMSPAHNALDDPNTDWAGGLAMQSLISQYDGAPSDHHHFPGMGSRVSARGASASGAAGSAYVQQQQQRGGKGIESRRGAHSRKRGRGGGEGYGSGSIGAEE